MEKKQFSLAVRAIVRNSIGEILLLKRSNASRLFADKWEYPGGKVDDGEPVVAALEREMLEETGLDAEFEHLLDSTEGDIDEIRVVTLFFEGCVRSETIKLSAEHSKSQWVPLPALLEQDLAGSLNEFTREFCRRHGYTKPSSSGGSGQEILNRAKLFQDVDAYKTEVGKFEKFAVTLESILKEGTRSICPLAIIQARCKKIDSFAGKILRKKKYKNPLSEITDLCGARVIVQTHAEVQLVCQLIREKFHIDEDNSPDKAASMNTSEFGYRSVHFVVEINPDENPDVQEELHKLKAEIQVRTILEHAWSDIGHDRLYKSNFDVPPVWLREAARIAATLESADAAFSRMVEGLEEYHSHYGAYLDSDGLQSELEIAESVLEVDPNNPAIVHRIARLAIAANQWGRAITVINDFKGIKSAQLLYCLGHSLCSDAATRPDSDEFKQGIQNLENAVESKNADSECYVRLAEVLDSEKKRFEILKTAFERTPTDPAVLSGYVWERIRRDRNTSVVPLLLDTLKVAIEKCELHVSVKIDLPIAMYRLAGFYLLIGDFQKSMIHATSAVHYTVAPAILDHALAELGSLIDTDKAFPGAVCLYRYLLLAKHSKFRDSGAGEVLRSLQSESPPTFRRPVLFIAGGCSPHLESKIEEWGDLLSEAVGSFQGTICSGGTKEGISGLVGEIGANSGDRIYTVGYLPETIPADGTATLDERFDKAVNTKGEFAPINGSWFTVLEPIQNWIDLVVGEVKPVDVKVLGFNGGDIAALEYRIAWSLGAQVAVVRGSGREAKVLEDQVINGMYPGILLLPADGATIRAFVNSDELPANIVDTQKVESLARIAHASFLEENRHKNPDPAMRDWDALSKDLRESNCSQIRYMSQILSTAGYEIADSDDPRPAVEFHDEPESEELNEMARLEHGRWNVERLRSGWRYGPNRDPSAKTSNYLEPWSVLSDETKGWDRNAIVRFPKLISKIGKKVVRRKSS